MDFKYIYFSVFLLLASCQEIEKKEAKPLNAKNLPFVVPPYDSAYARGNCTYGDEVQIKETKQYYYLSSHYAYSVGNYNRLDYQNSSGTCKVSIYIKGQKFVPKNFKLLPFDNNFNFANYNEAKMIITTSTGTYHSNRGVLAFKKEGDISLCPATFTNPVNKAEYTIFLSYLY